MSDLLDEKTVVPYLVKRGIINEPVEVEVLTGGVSNVVLGIKSRERDLVLKQAAQILRDSVRESDVVCRWGGEEFALFLPKCAIDDAERIAEKIRERVETLALHEEFYTVPLTISVGVAEYQVTENLKDVFARADKALYRAKASGRNQVVLSY